MQKELSKSEKKELLNLGKTKEYELNGWVIDHQNGIKKNGELYRSPLEFYLKNGLVKTETE